MQAFPNFLQAPRFLAFVSLASLAFATGCGGGLQLTPVKSTQNRPSNVAVYFKVQAGGEPVSGLTADQFRIYEDGSLVSENESKQTILNPEVAASHYTLLLIDMSGSVSGDPDAVKTLVDAATAFTDRVEKTHKVAVYTFDGSPEIHAVAPFGSPGGAKGAIRGLLSYKPQDPSTNLNGAVVKGLTELDRALAHAEHPMRFGTLVVFSDGQDRAGRATKDEMKKAIKDRKYEIFAIGLGKEMQESELKDIGRSGTSRTDNKQEVVKSFDDIAQRIEASTKSYYLLSYCSPSRAGKHEVKIHVQAKNEKGERSGSLVSEFDASGFTHGCDPNTPPSFDVSKGDALAPKKEDSEKSSSSGGEKGEVKAGARATVKPSQGGSVRLPPPPSSSPASSPQPAKQPQDFNP
ncbi:VWA domain-containing protein [Pendulispora rubella]|uniref:VWA domain-containing protein n=1 Tax=Pendulispora rubella TaxID=2741070 RepID=A0ABZ2L9Z1_9BACT